MKHETLTARLEALAFSITEHIDRVNRGGCAVLASIVGRHLQKMDVMVEVVTPTVCGFGGENGKSGKEVCKLVSNKKDTSEWDRNGLRRHHLAIRFRSGGKTWTWDSHGVREGAHCFGEDGRYRTTEEFGDGLSVRDCEAMASAPLGWNREFDRSQIPLMKHLARHHLQFGL